MENEANVMNEESVNEEIMSKEIMSKEIMNEEIEIGAFQIIAAVGTARSCYIEAIHAAKAHDYAEAERLIAQGDESFNQGHDAHLEMLGKEAEGDSVACLLIIHAEDQLMSAEGFKLIALELIDVYREMERLAK